MPQPRESRLTPGQQRMRAMRRVRKFIEDGQPPSELEVAVRGAANDIIDHARFQCDCTRCRDARNVLRRLL